MNSPVSGQDKKKPKHTQTKNRSLFLFSLNKKRVQHDKELLFSSQSFPKGIIEIILTKMKIFHCTTYVMGQLNASVHLDCQCLKYFPVSLAEEICNGQST